MQFWVSRDLFTDLIAGEAAVRTLLLRERTAVRRIQNRTFRKIITNNTHGANTPVFSWIMLPVSQWKWLTDNYLELELHLKPVNKVVVEQEPSID